MNFEAIKKESERKKGKMELFNSDRRKHQASMKR